MKILLTCPPMMRSVHRYESLMNQHDLVVICPQMTQVMSEVELIELVPQFDGWIIGDDPATRRVFEAGVAGQLRAAVKWGVGIDNVDMAAARELGIAIVNTPGMFGDEVADVAMGYVVALSRKLYSIHNGVVDNQWPKPTGISLKDKRVAVVGYGNIGQEVAARLLASKMIVTVYDPFAQLNQTSDSLSLKSWPEAIEEQDFIVLACALTPANRHLVNDELLGLCKPGIRIVNVSRGPLIDENALASHLQSGHVESAALEVFEIEPLPKTSPLHAVSDRCLFGSHNASNTQEAVDRTSHLAIELLVNQFSIAKS